MTGERWKEVKKTSPCPACGKPDWCAWTPDGAMLKCERTTDAPQGMSLVKAQDGGGLFRRDDDAPPVRRTHSTPAKRNKCPAKRQFVEAYDYCSKTGVLLSQVVRYDPKGFRQRRPDGHGDWIGNIDGVPRVLYRLPELLAADPAGWVFVPEGEKDVDKVRGVGLVATTNPGGKGKWNKLADDSALDGRRVAVIPDNDEDGGGVKHARDVAARLHGKAAVVKVLDLPDMPPKDDGKPRKDVSAWIEWLDCRTSEELAAALAEMAENAPAWTPPVVSTSTPAASPVEPYHPFPVDSLPEPMRSFVTQGAEVIGCDAAFVALPLLAASASAIGNVRRVELKRGWTEPAILWAAILGDSGTLKSPALELALRPLRRRQHEAIRQHAKEMEAHGVDAMRYEIDLATWKKSGGEGLPPAEPQAPMLPRCWCDDTTIEALAVLLLQNWRGLLMVRDELAGWLGGFDRYAQGKGSDAAKWLEMHGGRSIMVDRKTGDRKTIYVPRAAVSVTGGIQPATLQRVLKRAYFENGLAARLLLACPPRRVKQWTDNEIDPTTEMAVATVLDRLYSLEPALGQDGEPEPGIVRLSPDAKKAWVAFYNKHAQEHVDLTGDMSAAWAKLEGYAARLALVVHLVRWAVGDPILAGPDVMDEMSIAAGVALSRWFGQETRRAYAILEETEVDRERRRLVELVQRRGGSVTARDLMRHSRMYPTAADAEHALGELVEAQIGRWEDVQPSEQGGRPTRRFVLADTVDVDTTSIALEKSGVLSTEVGPAIAKAEAAIPADAAPAVDKTPELPKESEVSSTSTPARAALDPDRPGAVDLLDAEQRKRYVAIYHSRPASMPPTEKHARAWRAALTGGRPGRAGDHPPPGC